MGVILDTGPAFSSSFGEMVCAVEDRRGNGCQRPGAHVKQGAGSLMTSTLAKGAGCIVFLHDVV